jgi:hypothetical protein
MIGTGYAGSAMLQHLGYCTCCWHAWMVHDHVLQSRRHQIAAAGVFVTFLAADVTQDASWMPSFMQVCGVTAACFCVWYFMSVYGWGCGHAAHLAMQHAWIGRLT